MTLYRILSRDPMYIKEGIGVEHRLWSKRELFGEISGASCVEKSHNQNSS